MNDFTKIVRLGTMKTHDGRAYSVFCNIKYIGGKLSIFGVEGPLPSGNCLGAAGQIDMHQPQITNPAAGWNQAKFKRFFDIWRHWHLNDMNPTCEHQEARGETWETHPKAVCPDCGYRLGSQWLTREVPEDAIDFLKSLPDTDKTPAWV